EIQLERPTRGQENGGNNIDRREHRPSVPTLLRAVLGAVKAVARKYEGAEGEVAAQQQEVDHAYAHKEHIGETRPREGAVTYSQGRHEDDAHDDDVTGGQCANEELSSEIR